jgi:hypothetical protein
MRKSALAQYIELFALGSRSLLTNIGFCIESAVASFSHSALTTSYPLIMRWSHTTLISEFIFHTNNGFKLCIPQHDLCFLLYDSECIDRAAQHTIKAAVPQIQFGCGELVSVNPFALLAAIEYHYCNICCTPQVTGVTNGSSLLVDTTQSIRNCELTYTMARGVTYLQRQKSHHREVNAITVNLLHTELL